MARFEAREVRDGKGGSLGWFVFDGENQLPGPPMTAAVALSEAKKLNLQHEQKLGKDEVPEPPRRPSMGR